MKRIFLVLTIVLTSITLFPQKAAGQFGMSSAVINTRLNGRINILRTRRALQRKVAMRANQRAKKRRIQQRKRRVSMLKDITEPKFRIDSNLPERSSIV